MFAVSGAGLIVFFNNESVMGVWEGTALAKRKARLKSPLLSSKGVRTFEGEAKLTLLPLIYWRSDRAISQGERGKKFENHPEKERFESFSSMENRRVQEEWEVELKAFSTFPQGRALNNGLELSEKKRSALGRRGGEPYLSQRVPSLHPRSDGGRATKPSLPEGNLSAQDGSRWKGDPQQIEGGSSHL